MTTATISPYTASDTVLLDRLVPAPGNRALRNVLIAVVGTLLLAVASKIKIPLPPVPMTAQTLVLLVLAMACGWKLAGATVLLYLAEGAVGLPVFAGTPEKGIGLAYMTGPTGGYLIGFLLAAVTVGYLAERGWDRNFGTTAVAMFIGNALIYVPGLLWLGTVVGWDKPVLEWGITPFLFGDVIKLVIAAILLPAVWKFLRRT